MVILLTLIGVYICIGITNLKIINQHKRVDHIAALENLTVEICKHICFVTDCPDRPCHAIEGLDIITAEPCSHDCIGLAKKILGH